MPEMKAFEVVVIARSDGSDTGPGYWPPTAPAKAPAAPSEPTPKPKPQMVRLSEDDPRFVEWRVKLGMLLKQELGPESDEGNAWYVEFPRGYWLYEKSKHLWVSGYPVKRKLFKSPQDFALHLIWLLSSSKDYQDCSCVHCNAHNVSKVVLEDTPTMAVSELPPRKPSTKETPVPVPSVAASKQTPVPLPPMPGLTKEPPKPRSPEPPPWLLHSEPVFRIGDMVWLQAGSTWRLGVLAQKSKTGYLVAPLGSALMSTPGVIKPVNELRPYHAFSVPELAIHELRGKRYQDVRWEAVLNAYANDPPRREMALLDASKMAASHIENSFSLWAPLPFDPSNPKTTYYPGAYLGAESIELGDGLRVKQLPLNLVHLLGPEISTNGLVMGVRAIYTVADLPNDVFFDGPIYRPFDPAKDKPDSIVPESRLPVLMRDEAHWRSQSTASQRRSGWVKLIDMACFKESDIGGRFYPAHRALPILDPQRFQQAMSARQTDGLKVYMNNRLSAPDKYVGRVRNRREAMGWAVADGTKLKPERHVKEVP